MVALCGFAILVRSNYVASGAAILLNFPVALIALVVGPIIAIWDLTGWTAGAIAAAFLWFSWYGLIRFLEWRSFRGAPLSISSDPTSSPQPQS